MNYLPSQIFFSQSIGSPIICVIFCLLRHFFPLATFHRLNRGRHGEIKRKTNVPITLTWSKKFNCVDTSRISRQKTFFLFSHTRSHNSWAAWLYQWPDQWIMFNLCAKVTQTVGLKLATVFNELKFSLLLGLNSTGERFSYKFFWEIEIKKKT